MINYFLLAKSKILPNKINNFSSFRVVSGQFRCLWFFWFWWKYTSIHRERFSLLQSGIWSSLCPLMKKYFKITPNLMIFHPDCIMRLLESVENVSCHNWISSELKAWLTTNCIHHKAQSSTILIKHRVFYQCNSPIKFTDRIPVYDARFFLHCGVKIQRGNEPIEKKDKERKETERLIVVR